MISSKCGTWTPPSLYASCTLLLPEPDDLPRSESEDCITESRIKKEELIHIGMPLTQSVQSRPQSLASDADFQSSLAGGSLDLMIVPMSRRARCACNRARSCRSTPRDATISFGGCASVTSSRRRCVIQNSSRCK